MSKETLTLTQRVQKTIETLRPYLQSDGGDMELVSVDEDEGVVYLRLQGACVGCPSSMMTLQMGIENQLKTEIPQVKHVIAV